MPRRSRAKLRRLIDPAQLGMAVFTPRAQALRPAQGSTDFGQYFTYFSFFLVVSALLWPDCFFNWGSSSDCARSARCARSDFRARASGAFSSPKDSCCRSSAPIAGNRGRRRLRGRSCLYGLKTWWRGAVGTGLLTLHVSAESLAGGRDGRSGGRMAVRDRDAAQFAAHASPRDLLCGNARRFDRTERASRWLRIVAAVVGAERIAMVARRSPTRSTIRPDSSEPEHCC